LELCSLEEVLDEKLELQSALLHYERKHGHPESREEKDEMKDIYERYRNVKRLARRSSSAKSRETSSELVPIPEEEAVSLTLASPAHRITLEVPSLLTLRQGASMLSRHDMDLPDIESNKHREDEHWHAMSRADLGDIQRKVREEKRKLRRTVKEFEETFRSKTGRKLQKEDREPLESTYANYKNTKSKLKLIDALMSKLSAKM